VNASGVQRADAYGTSRESIACCAMPPRGGIALQRCGRHRRDAGAGCKLAGSRACGAPLARKRTLAPCVCGSSCVCFSQRRAAGLQLLLPAPCAAAAHASQQRSGQCSNALRDGGLADSLEVQLE
jgi:hypothetical protein